MALTADQTAMLQLLLERGQGYAELSTLLAVDEAAVRSRARAALGELAGADPDRAVGLTDYLLGQADPIGRADAVRHLRENADDRLLATDVLTALRELFPGAELPRLPGEPSARRFLRRAPGTSPRPASAGEGGALGLSARQTRFLVGGGAGALLLVVVVLAITGAFGGDDDGAATDTETTTAAADGEETTIERVRLTAVGGGDAEGEAIFGLATGDQPYVDLSLSGLDPAPGGQTYVVWLLLTERDGYPIAPISVSDQGEFQDRFAIPATALPLVARVQTIDISIADDEELARLIQAAQRRAAQPDADISDLLLSKPGNSVLAGTVPRAPGGGGASGG